MSKFFKKYFDLKLLKYLVVFYTFVILIDVSKKSYFKFNGEGRFVNYSWFELFTYNIFLDWVVVLFFMAIIAILTKLMFEKGLNDKVILFSHLFLSFFMGFFIFFATSVIIYFTSDYYTSFKQSMNNVTFRHFMLVIDLNFLVYFAMLGIIYGYYYLQKIKGIEAQKNRLQQQLINSKMNVLKSQLHPHFVFNTLNSISSLIDIDKNKSQNLIADFGDLFRGILEIKNEHLIPLEKEINLLDKYIDIISVRFSDHLIINKNIEEELKDCLVPNMIIQPLLENAIKHGYSYNKTNLIIDLSIFKKEKYLIIIIENDGDLLNEKFNELLGLGTGIRTTQERLYTLFGSNFKFILKNNKAKTGVLAFIKIPLKTVLINTPSQW